MNEFSLIKRYFADSSFVRKDVHIGIGDDAAVTSIPEKQLLVTTTDTLLEGVHFLPNTAPADIVHKAVAANLSDLAAMGAEPSWLSLSLSIPELNETWLNEFSNELGNLTEYFSVQLIGGDTVKGPLGLTITAQGFVPEDSTLTRSGANSGDWLYVTGSLGDAGAGLDILQNKLSVADTTAKDYLIERHHRPSPRVLAGTVLRRVASSCIDISDGLLQDVMHLANASNTGVLIHLEKLPISEHLGKNVKDLEQALKYACVAGDDYELLFTVPEEQRTTLETALDSYAIAHTCIGQMTGASGKLDLRLQEQPYNIDYADKLGFTHF